MSYSHILVAVDFDKDNQEVIDKAVKLAKPLQAKLSLIHINQQVIGGSGFVGLVDVDLAGLDPAEPMSEVLSKRLDTLAIDIDYPIVHKFVVNGDISHSMEEPVQEAGIDLIVCGHHHSFWSRLFPSIGGLVHTSPVDLLIVSLGDE